MDRRVGVKRQDRPRDWTAVAAVLIWIITFASILSGESRAEALTVGETELLVRAVHFEGLPEEQARRVGPEGVARLIEMLNDPSEVSTHANVLIVLGLSGEPGALDAISRNGAIMLHPKRSCQNTTYRWCRKRSLMLIRNMLPMLTFPIM